MCVGLLSHMSYFICLVVILRVVLEDLGLFVVVKIAGEIVEVCFFSPYFAIDKPNHQLNINRAVEVDWHLHLL